MRRLISTLILVACLAGLAACGSSNSSSHAAPPSNVVLGSSTSVTSPTFRAYLLHSLRSGRRPVPVRVAQKSADCGIQKFLSQGIKTYADFINPRNASLLHKDGVECANQTGYHK
jgi:hypothetical protein